MAGSITSSHNSPDPANQSVSELEQGAARGSVREAKEPIFTFTFVMAWVINFSQYLILYLLITTMALYAVKEFAASNATSGLASSAFVIGATIARMFAGYLVDRLGNRLMMLCGVIVAVVSCAAYIPIHSLGVFIVVRGVHGIGYAVVSTATMALAQALIPSGRRAEGTGYFALGSTLATAVGPALGLWIVGSFSYSVLFASALGASIIGGVLSLLVMRGQSAEVASEKAEEKPSESNGAGEDYPETEREQHDEQRAQPKLTLRSMMHPNVVPIGVFMLIVGCCYAGIITYLNSYGEDRDVASGAGLFFVAYAVVMMLGRFYLGRLQDEKGDNIVVYMGLVSFALALVLLGVAQTDWQVMLAGALTGLGYGSLMPAAQAISVRLVPMSEMGTGISTLFLLLDVGVAFGPIALGYLVSAVGFGVMYEVLAAVVLLAGVWYFFIHGRRHQPKLGIAH
ncbi:MFS transporter [Corynebacterium anserum]|uniref:MFS transporter n=1 Tax=Corynebacterium anserum TaxID=2684406 RepID=A0A7G7YMA8_9CORY|nr:MFS transporter [Corynebacterium anserum]